MSSTALMTAARGLPQTRTTAAPRVQQCQGRTRSRGLSAIRIPRVPSACRVGPVQHGLEARATGREVEGEGDDQLMEGWEDMVSATVDCYNTHGENLRTETKDRYGERLLTTFLGALGLPSKGKRVLDLGCGPGRDSVRFQSLGMVATALDGSSTMAEMARDNGCETVLLQDLHDLDLQDASFDGIFAKRSIFHVYSPLLPKVLRQLWCALDDGGVLFSSNARALDELFAGDHDGIHPAVPAHAV